MKLHYFSPQSDPTVRKDYRNFGDDLNPWLFEKLLPDVFDEDDRTIFVAIGSHMCDKFAARFRHQHKIVFGTGWGSKGRIGRIDESWSVYCVRGPITAESMGLAPSAAVTDAAALIRTVHPPRTERDVPISYMPHCGSANSGWQDVCERLGIQYIDPRSPLEEVLDKISRSEVLCTEALHGAITADALRVRWIPTITTQSISRLKWTDWCASVGIEYSPHPLRPLWEPNAGSSCLARLKFHTKVALAVRGLKRILATVRPVMSEDSIIQERTDELVKRLEQFREDFFSGRWSGYVMQGAAAEVS